jgi:hypothetical protein
MTTPASMLGDSATNWWARGGGDVAAMPPQTITFALLSEQMPS